MAYNKGQNYDTSKGECWSLRDLQMLLNLHISHWKFLVQCKTISVEMVPGRL